ncbi:MULTISPECIES: hypothetical protein [Streptomyces]|uniref:hypothetical protein n=1 Tax=Streptomyces TaxID=1883 RepID=UPI0036744AE8
MAAGLRNGPLVRRTARGSRINTARIKGWTTEVGTTQSTACRVSVLCAGGYVLVTMVSNGHGVLWWICGIWTLASFRAGLRAERQDAADATFLQLVRDLIGDHNGVHLARIVTALNAPLDKDTTPWEFDTLRVELDRLTVPVRDSLKVEGDVSPGIHLDDLTSVCDLQVTPPPGEGSPSRKGKAAGNYRTTPTVTVSANGAQITVTPPRKETAA